MLDTKNIDWIPSLNLPEVEQSSIVAHIIKQISGNETDTGFALLQEINRDNSKSQTIDESMRIEDSSFHFSDSDQGMLHSTAIFQENKENETCCNGSSICPRARSFEQQISILKTENSLLTAEVKKGKRDLDWLKNDEMCKRYTGINDKATLQRIFDFVESVMFQPACQMTKEQLFVMSLRKLRRNTSFFELADDYAICSNTASKYFNRTMLVLYDSLKYALNIPSKEISIRHNPKIFQQHYGNRRIFIIDCFEVYSETPQETRAAIQHRSAYKQHQTTKFMIAMNCNGGVAFISHAYAGRCSDRFIVKDCGFLDVLEVNDVVIADKGFDIHDLISVKGATLNIPTFLRKKDQLNPLHIEHDKQITGLRVHIERLIGVLRSKYTYLNGPIEVDALRRFENNHNSLDVIVRVACILLNFNRSIVPF